MSEQVRYLVVRAAVRYWEDATVNGVEDTDGSLIPCRVGDLWCPVIDLTTGTIVSWPTGTTASIHYKVCDAGEYWLLDPLEEERWKWNGSYVPDRLLCIGDTGFGDYIILNVLEDGRILGWAVPEIDFNEWTKEGAQ